MNQSRYEFKINSVPELCFFVHRGVADWEQFGRVNVTEHDNLLMFSYKAECQYDEEWNAFEMMSRGLIIEKYTGHLVALPYPKFFNWAQREGMDYTTARLSRVAEKMDGSLGIMYWDINDRPCIATRGSFTSEQALWATEHLREHYATKYIPKHLTLLFEIIYPGNRIVIDYRGKEDLILLDARDMRTGMFLSAKEVDTIARDRCFDRPKSFTFGSYIDLLSETETLDLSMEGYVAWFEDGSIFKFKGAEYFRVHRLVTGFTPKKLRQAMLDGEVKELRDLMPDEFHEWFDSWLMAINTEISTVYSDVVRIYHSIFSPDLSRKEFAEQAKEYPTIAHYLFARYDGRNITPIILKSHDWRVFDRELLDKSLIPDA